jgi:heterodisulfide reductase subunit B
MCANLTSLSALAWSIPGHCTFIGTKGKRRLGNTSQALIKDIIETAYDGGADMIVTPCPVCQMNIEVYQNHINQKYKTNFKMPCVYYSTLMSVAYSKNGREAGLDGQVIKAKQLEEIASK